MFTSIVVALDLEATGDRALPFAASLAALGRLPVELLTVSSPGLPADVDVFELERRAAAHGLGDYSCVVLHDEHAGTAIADHMASLPNGLLVMGTTAKGPVTSHVFGSVSEYVLAHVDCAVLVTGPRAAAHRLVSPTLIACVGDSDRTDAAAPPIASWLDAFGGQTCIVTVEPNDTTSDSTEATARLTKLSERLAANGGGSPTQRILRGDDPVRTLQDFSQGFTDPVFAAVSARWTDRQFHRHSVTRNLVRHSPWPILVVPAQATTAGEPATRHFDAAC